MKKKLLVTLGDSFTEGVGCYDPALNLKNVTLKNLPEKIRLSSIERFHRLGWPNKLGMKLGYDKVINLGSQATSNYCHLKLFIDKFLPRIGSLKQDYDILGIWMMTEPSRFSFFSQEGIQSFLPSRIGIPPENLTGSPLEKAYLEEFSELEIGPLREQIMLIKSSELIFKSLSIPFLYTSWNSSFVKIYEYFLSSNFLSLTPGFCDYDRSTKYLSPICRHPNEDGYRIIAEIIYSQMLRYHNRLVINSEANSISWEWDGSVQYKQRKVEKSLF